MRVLSSGVDMRRHAGLGCGPDCAGRRFRATTSLSQAAGQEPNTKLMISGAGTETCLSG